MPRRVSLLEVLAERVLIYDGAMGTELQGSGLDDAAFTLAPEDRFSETVNSVARSLEQPFLEGCNEILNLTRPEVVEKVHLDYFAAGADLIETNTFGSTSVVLAEYGVQDLLFEISLAAGQIARRAADKVSTSDRPRFVVGAIGPGTRLVSLGQATWAEIETSYCTAFKGLIEGGSDALLIETLQDLLMSKAALVGAVRAMAETETRLPLFMQVTMEQTGTMLLGTELGAALNMAEAFPEVTAFGINCSLGPVEMASHVRFLSQNSTRPISVLPNAGLPVMEGGKAVYKLSPDELAKHHTHFVKDFGAAMVGGCCGTTPEHIRVLSSALQGTQHGQVAHWQRIRNLFPGFDFTLSSNEQAEAIKLVGCSSLYQFQPYKQDTSFLIVGEKTNANGSKAFRDMLAAENWEGLTELARELEGEGSHILDVCTAYVGRDEVRDMATLLSYYNRHVTVPIMIDSTETPVIERSLQCLAGKPLVNSINFEDGGGRVEAVLSLCKRYGAGVVALTIDESGMAKTSAQKIDIAERLLAATRRYGLPDHDVFLDCLTFTLGSGDEEFRKSAVETIDAIQEITRRHPGVNTILGVSNVSFGLKPAARLVLNSAFLHYALEAGLSSAIVHFSKIKPENKIEPEVWEIVSDLVFDRRKFSVA